MLDPLSTTPPPAPAVAAVPTLTTERELTITTTFEEAGDSLFAIALGRNEPIAIPVRIPTAGRWSFKIELVSANT
jgi:hypothetical protein